MTITTDMLKPDSTHLAVASLATGVALLAIFLPAGVAPAPVSRLWKAFPRSKIAAWALAAIALCWAAAWLMAMPFQILAVFKRLMPVLLPVSIVLVATLLGNLLACRATGGLLALIPCPLLSAAQWHPSPARYAIIVLAYAMAVYGMVLICQPYVLRNHIARATSSDGAFRAVGIAGSVLAIALMALGAWVF